MKSILSTTVYYALVASCYGAVFAVAGGCQSGSVTRDGENASSTLADVLLVDPAYVDGVQWWTLDTDDQQVRGAFSTFVDVYILYRFLDRQSVVLIDRDGSDLAKTHRPLGEFFVRPNELWPEHLEVPNGIVFLEDGYLLVMERSYKFTGPESKRFQIQCADFLSQHQQFKLDLFEWRKQNRIDQPSLREWHETASLIGKHGLLPGH